MAETQKCVQGLIDYDPTPVTTCRRLYFAYGANLNREKMAIRCPYAEPLGAAVLHDHKLVFRAVATVERARGVSVPGALWVITARCERALDSYEGYPWLYGKNEMTVLDVDHKEIEALLYVMVRKQPLSSPTAMYLRIIHEGYDDFGLGHEPLRDALVSCREQDLPIE